MTTQPTSVKTARTPRKTMVTAQPRRRLRRVRRLDERVERERQEEGDDEQRDDGAQPADGLHDGVRREHADGADEADVEGRLPVERRAARTEVAALALAALACRSVAPGAPGSVRRRAVRRAATRALAPAVPRGDAAGVLAPAAQPRAAGCSRAGRARAPRRRARRARRTPPARPARRSRGRGPGTRPSGRAGRGGTRVHRPQMLTVASLRQACRQQGRVRPCACQCGGRAAGAPRRAPPGARPCPGREDMRVRDR